MDWKIHTSWRSCSLRISKYISFISFLLKKFFFLHISHLKETKSIIIIYFTQNSQPYQGIGPTSNNIDTETEINNYYCYQYIPLILVVFAFLFYLPHMTWKHLMKEDIERMSIRKMVRMNTEESSHKEDYDNWLFGTSRYEKRKRIIIIWN